MLKIIHTFVPYIITFPNHIFLFLMKKRLLRTMLMALCGGAVALTACVDKDYDLTNLDTTMKVGNGTFMLPTSSTEDIQLNNLFSLTDDGAVMESADGFYYLHKGGSSTEQTIHIGEIKFESPNIKGFENVTLYGQDVPASTKAYAPSPVSDPAPAVILWEYPFEEKTEIKFNEKSSTQINADVLDIKEIALGNDQTVTFKLTVKDYGTKLKSLRFGTLRIELPLGFDIEKAIYNDNHPDYKDKDPKDSENHVVETTPQLETNKQVLLFPTAPLELAKTNKANIVLKLKGAYMGNNGCFSFEPGATPMKDMGKVNMLESEVKILGDLHVADVDINYDALSAADLVQIAMGNYGAVLPTSIKFDGKGEFKNSVSLSDNNVYVSKFTGSIHHAIDKIDDIQLNNLPDFLTEDDVCLDLSAPQLFLKVNTNLPAAATVRDLVMTSYPKNGAAPCDVVIAKQGVTPSISFLSKENGYVVPLVKQLENIEYPSEYANSTFGAPVQVSNLEQLLVKVPDHLSIMGGGNNGRLVVELNNCVDLPVNSDYKVQFDYMAHCKLTFGPNFKLVYRSDETGIDLGSGLDKISFDALIIEAQMKTTIPLETLLEATPIDKDGNVINGMEISKQVRSGGSYKVVNPLTIRANADGSQEADNIRLVLKAKQGSINDYLKESAHQFDGIKLKATLQNTHNIDASLRATSYIKLTNVRIGVDGGVTIIDK